MAPIMSLTTLTSSFIDAEGGSRGGEKGGAGAAGEVETGEARGGLAKTADDPRDGVHDDQGHPGSASEGVHEVALQAEVRCGVPAFS